MAVTHTCYLSEKAAHSQHKNIKLYQITFRHSFQKYVSLTVGFGHNLDVIFFVSDGGNTNLLLYSYTLPNRPKCYSLLKSKMTTFSKAYIM